MTRTMIDCTHAGLPAALPFIRALPAGNIVALYGTGSPEIMATPADIASIPEDLTIVLIDQGFTGSPNFAAMVRDCENGAWILSDAVDKSGWQVPRPTLYLGFPDTVAEAHNDGWRGDVWLVNPSSSPPAKPMPVPPGINVVAEQWDFSAIDFDRSVVFDNYWPRSKPVSIIIPDFAGFTAGAAHDQLRTLGLVPIAVHGQRATEIVTSTEPVAGTSVAKGSDVTILTTVNQTLMIGKYALDLSGTLRLK